VSADSIVPGAGNPQALNRYAYVFNNPLKYVDPSGHAPDAWTERYNNAHGLFWESECHCWANGAPEFRDREIAYEIFQQDFVSQAMSWIKGHLTDGKIYRQTLLDWNGIAESGQDSDLIGMILAAMAGYAEDGRSPQFPMFAMRNRLDCNNGQSSTLCARWAGGATLLSQIVTSNNGRFFSQFNGLESWIENPAITAGKLRLDTHEEPLKAVLAVSWQVFAERIRDEIRGADAFVASRTAPSFCKTLCEAFGGNTYWRTAWIPIWQKHSPRNR
jgi:hypothetical protein